MVENKAVGVMRRYGAALLGLLAFLAAPDAGTGAARAQAQPKAVENAKGADRASASVAPAAQAATVHARPALWVVKDKDTTVYLFGTVHLMKPQVVWFEGTVRKAYDSAGEVVLEVIDDEEKSAAAMLAKAVNPTGELTSTMLPEDMRVKLDTLARAHGLPMAFLDRMKPWFVSLTLSMAPYRKLGFDPAQGVDAVLKAQAQQDGKALTGLETASEQIDLIDSLPQDQQIAMLKSSIAEQDKAQTVLEEMIAAWAKGDPAALGALMNQSMAEAPDATRLLLHERNARWADWIEARMKRPGTLFVAVGAGHLGGAESVQDKLAALGLKARRVDR